MARQQGSVLGLVLLTLLSASVVSAHFPYYLPLLRYSTCSLEPAIDCQTMYIHHTKQHLAAVTGLNTAIAKYEETLGDRTVESLLNDVGTSSIPADITTAVRNSGGSHYNHALFWITMTPNPACLAPEAQISTELRAALDSTFGGYAGFKTAFTAAASTRFGSGWAWLIVTKTGLQVTSTPNQDNPLMVNIPGLTYGIPILGLDVWEHAYFLKYRNVRANYIAEWFNVVNWRQVSKNYARAVDGKTADVFDNIKADTSKYGKQCPV